MLSNSTCEPLSTTNAKLAKKSSRKRKAESINVPTESTSGDDGVPLSKRVKPTSPGADVHEYRRGIRCSPPECNACRINGQYRFNPVSENWQRQVCQTLGLQFIGANACDAGGSHVTLKHPMFKHIIRGDGNRLFRIFYYLITGSETQHFEVRCRIIQHLRAVGHVLLRDFSNWGIDQLGTWGTTVEMLVLAHMVGANV